MIFDLPPNPLPPGQRLLLIQDEAGRLLVYTAEPSSPQRAADTVAALLLLDTHATADTRGKPR